MRMSVRHPDVLGKSQLIHSQTNERRFSTSDVFPLSERDACPRVASAPVRSSAGNAGRSAAASWSSFRACKAEHGRFLSGDGASVRESVILMREAVECAAVRHGCLTLPLTAAGPQAAEGTGQEAEGAQDDPGKATEAEAQ